MDRYHPAVNSWPWCVCFYLSEEVGQGKRYLQEIKDEFAGADGEMPSLNLKLLESMVGFFVHLAMAFLVLFPFLKGFYLTMNSWRPAREENG